MAFCEEHPKWGRNPKFTPLSKTTSIPIPFICGVSPPPTPGGARAGKSSGEQYLFCWVCDWFEKSWSPNIPPDSQGILNKILYGESPTDVQHLPFYIPLSLPPLSHTFNWEMVTLSNSNLVHWIPFSCCKCTVLNMNTALNLQGSFLVFFTAIKWAC